MCSLASWHISILQRKGSEHSATATNLARQLAFSLAEPIALLSPEWQPCRFDRTIVQIPVAIVVRPQSDLVEVLVWGGQTHYRFRQFDKGPVFVQERSCCAPGQSQRNHESGNGFRILYHQYFHACSTLPAGVAGYPASSRT